jgi:hypothetical protein
MFNALGGNICESMHQLIELAESVRWASSVEPIIHSAHQLCLRVKIGFKLDLPHFASAKKRNNKEKNV